MAERTEWPTDEHLAELRSRGIAPINSFSVSSFAALCFAGSLYGMRSKAEVLMERLSGSESFADLTAALQGHELAALFVVPLVLMILGAFALGLLQSRFLIRSGAAAFNLGRLSPFAEGQELRARERLALIPASLGLCILAAVIAGSFAAFALPPLLAADAGSVGPAAQIISRRAVAGACVVFGVGSLSAWLIGRFFFMLRHRMTREERASEGREDSVSRL